MFDLCRPGDLQFARTAADDAAPVARAWLEVRDEPDRQSFASSWPTCERVGLLSGRCPSRSGWLRGWPMTAASTALAPGPDLRLISEAGLQARRIAGAVNGHAPLVLRALPVSATLAANEAMAARLRRGEPVLPLGFGEAGLPVHPALRAVLAASATVNTLHATVARAMAALCADAGLLVRPPQASFYLYPDFGPWRDHLQARYGVTTSPGLARLLVQRYGAVTLPGTAFGDRPATLTLRLATARIYGNTADQQEAALAAAGPLKHPPLAAALTRFKEILADLNT
jgi:hypothetical protein